MMYQRIREPNMAGESSYKKVLVPIKVGDNTRQAPAPEYESTPAPAPDDNPIEMDTEPPVSKSPPKKFIYMTEFMARIDPILQGLLAREAISSETICAMCSKSCGKWRCRDCTFAKVLCRSCMRQSHFDNPFHRIECWTGSFFRPAGLWEVGVFLSLNHCNETNVCTNIIWQHQIQESFQAQKNLEDKITSGPQFRFPFHSIRFPFRSFPFRSQTRPGCDRGS